MCLLIGVYEAIGESYLLYYIQRKSFSERQFSCIIVRVLTWRVQKMRSAASSEGPRLVRIAVHKQGWPYRDTFSNEWHEAPRISRGLLNMQAMCHKALSEARDEVCSLS